MDKQTDGGAKLDGLTAPFTHPTWRTEILPWGILSAGNHATILNEIAWVGISVALMTTEIFSCQNAEVINFIKMILAVTNIKYFLLVGVHFIYNIKVQFCRTAPLRCWGHIILIGERQHHNCWWLFCLRRQATNSYVTGSGEYPCPHIPCIRYSVTLVWYSYYRQRGWSTCI